MKRFINFLKTDIKIINSYFLLLIIIMEIIIIVLIQNYILDQHYI